MTTYYIDPVSGSDVTGDGTPENPYYRAPSQAGAAVTHALGNTYLIKRGTSMSLPIDANFSGNASSEAQRTVYGAYGSGNNPVIDVAGAAAYGLRVQNKDYVTFQDFDIFGATNTGLQALNNVTRACNYLRANRVRAYDCGFDGVSLTHPESASGVAPSAARGVMFEECEGHRNGQHGVAITAYAAGAVLRNCKGSGNSLTSSGWGVYQGGFATTYTGATGWAIAGNVKSRTIPTGAKPYGVVSGNTVGGVYFLAENVGTPTTPGTGEWGWSGSTLYVNIGTVPGGYAIAVVHQPNTNAIIDGAEGWDHQLFDGVGVGMDRGTYGGLIRRVRGWNNAGSAVQVNQAKDITAHSVVGEGNREAVYFSTVGGTSVIAHVTSLDDTYGVRVERQYTGDTTRVKNCALSPGTAILVATNSGTVDNNYNAYSGALDGVSAGANDLNEVLLLGPTGLPLPGSPLIGAGVNLGPRLDASSKRFRRAPAVGAYEFIAPRNVRY